MHMDYKWLQINENVLGIIYISFKRIIDESLHRDQQNAVGKREMKCET